LADASATIANAQAEVYRLEERSSVGRVSCAHNTVAISDGRPYRDSYFLVNGHIWSMEGVEESVQS
jgi:hypothetical protein